MGRLEKDGGPHFCSVPLPCEQGAEIREPVSPRHQSPLKRVGKVPNSLDAQRTGPLMTRICQSMCLVYGPREEGRGSSP